MDVKRQQDEYLEIDVKRQAEEYTEKR